MENLVGNVFGRLKVLSFGMKNKNHKVYWNCECECGKIKLIRADVWKLGNTKSCGCYNSEIRHKHNKTNKYGVESQAFIEGSYRRWMGPV